MRSDTFLTVSCFFSFICDEETVCVGALSINNHGSNPGGQLHSSPQRRLLILFCLLLSYNRHRAGCRPIDRVLVCNLIVLVAVEVKYLSSVSSRQTLAEILEAIKATLL